VDFTFFSGVKIRQIERSETQRPPGLGALDAILVGLINAHENDFSPFDWGQAWTNPGYPENTENRQIWGGIFDPKSGPETGKPQFSSIFGFFDQFRPNSTNFGSPWGVGVPDAPASPSRRSTLGARSTIDDGCSLGTSPDKRPIEKHKMQMLRYVISYLRPTGSRLSLSEKISPFALEARF